MMEAYDAIATKREQAAALAERDAVVAWLREELDRWGAKQRLVDARGSRAHARELSAIVSAVAYAADAIERGEHVEEKGTPWKCTSTDPSR